MEKKIKNEERQKNIELGLHGIKETYNKDVSISQTKYHKGGLRSGKRLQYEGSLVIIGDVNDGAEVVAGENIIVLGKLRGLAHAGANGNKSAIIAANVIQSPQIRIADKIIELSMRNNENKEIKTFAFINENDIIVLS